MEVTSTDAYAGLDMGLDRHDSSFWVNTSLKGFVSFFAAGSKTGREKISFDRFSRRKL
jgi:hypothetical protein